MIVIAFLVFLILQAVALLHLGWAFGMSWPAESREMLSAAVVGRPESCQMPPRWLTIMAAMGISLAGWVALWGAGWFGPEILDGLRGWALGAAAVIFALRGGMSYLPFGPLQASVEPFRTLDIRYFSPLCLALALGYLLILPGR